MPTIPTIETPRLLLRAFRVDDTDDYAAQVFSDPDVMHYMNASGKVPRHPQEYAHSYIVERNKQWEQQGFGAWAVLEKASSAFMGHVGLFIIEGTDVVEVGYAIGKRFWGKGYATEAAREALRFGLEVKLFDEIVAIAFPDNRASIRVMQKLGMQDHGLTDQYYGLTLACYVITREAWLQA